jgi:hypothetical protein
VVHKSFATVVGLAIVVLLPITSPVTAQSATKRIFVDATTDSGGSVGDLRQEEFQVTEGGERRDITAVTRARRPLRLILMVDTTEGIRQPIGQIRKAISGFLETVDAQHEMMMLTLAGTMQVKVQPTTDRKKLLVEADKLFGTSGTNPMHRMIEEVFKRFGQTTELRPVMAIVTTEGFASMQQVNPKDLARLGTDIKKRGGVVHTVRVLVPIMQTLPAGERPTDYPVSTMVSLATDGISRDTSPAGLGDELQRLATAINQAHASTVESYQVEYASAPVKGKKPLAPEVTVTRAGVRVASMAAP